MTTLTKNQISQLGRNLSHLWSGFPLTEKGVSEFNDFSKNYPEIIKLNTKYYVEKRYLVSNSVKNVDSAHFYFGKNVVVPLIFDILSSAEVEDNLEKIIGEYPNIGEEKYLYIPHEWEKHVPNSANLKMSLNESTILVTPAINHKKNLLDPNFLNSILDKSLNDDYNVITVNKNRNDDLAIKTYDLMKEVHENYLVKWNKKELTEKEEVNRKNYWFNRLEQKGTQTLTISKDDELVGTISDSIFDLRGSDNENQESSNKRLYFGYLAVKPEHRQASNEHGFTIPELLIKMISEHKPSNNIILKESCSSVPNVIETRQNLGYRAFLYLFRK